MKIMRKVFNIVGLMIFAFYITTSSALAANSETSNADICRPRCMVDEGYVCLERGPCEPINDFLLKAAEECRVNPTSKYMPITKLLFVDILSQIIRIDREFPEGKLDSLTEEQRYLVKTRLLADKGIDIFVDTKPLSPLTREELAEVLKEVTIEKDLGFSSGLADQGFDLRNAEFVVYDLNVYVDDGSGATAWEMRKNFDNSQAGSKHYVAKLDSCNDAKVVFGDDNNGAIPPVGSRIKAVYKFFGREDEVVTDCEIAMLMSDPDVAKSLKDTYNPSRILTMANFADLLIKTRHMQKELPRDFYTLSDRVRYVTQSEILLRNGIDIFVGADPEDLLTREQLARVLYNWPVEEILGISNGESRQSFELNNAGFVIYDLHVSVNEEASYEEWYRQNSFMESSSVSKDYLVKLDSGNYASVYFGDDRKGKIPVANSPIKATYRLYAPVNMVTEDDIICVLGKIVPVAEAYEPPAPPFEFPDPTDGHDDPATPI